MIPNQPHKIHLPDQLHRRSDGHQVLELRSMCSLLEGQLWGVRAASCFQFFFFVVGYFPVFFFIFGPQLLVWVSIFWPGKKNKNKNVLNKPAAFYGHPQLWWCFWLVRPARSQTFVFEEKIVDVHPSKPGLRLPTFQRKHSFVWELSITFLIFSCWN